MSKNEKAGFEIKRTITKHDIPSMGRHKKSKYDPIYKSCKTLRKEEGIEVLVENSGVRSVVGKGLKKRFPRRRFKLTTRRGKDGKLYLYIIRQ